MSLKQQIDADIKKAMLAKEPDTLRALRSIKSSILLAETEKGAKEEFSQDKEIQLLSKAAKQRRESMELFEQQGRDDLASTEKSELDIIERYLPKQMSEAELETAVQRIVEKLGATGMKDMGKVMGAANKVLAGQADGKAIANTVKNILQNQK